MVYTSKEQLVNGLRNEFANTEYKDEKSKAYSEARLCKALMSVYANQLEDEKQEGDVRHNNGVGFTPVDAKILTSFAEQYKSRGSLSQKQIAILHQKMPKYAAQLIKGSLSKGLIVKEGGAYKFVK